MTDEERYAAELDSAFDDYDSVPRAETPPRREPDLDLDASAATEPRMSARQRSAARRGSTPVRSEYGDEMKPDAGARGGSNGLRNLLLGLLGLLLVVLLAYWLWAEAATMGTWQGTTVPAGSAAAQPLPPWKVARG